MTIGHEEDGGRIGNDKSGVAPQQNNDQSGLGVQSVVRQRQVEIVALVKEIIQTFQRTAGGTFFFWK